MTARLLYRERPLGEIRLSIQRLAEEMDHDDLFPSTGGKEVQCFPVRMLMQTGSPKPVLTQTTEAKLQLGTQAKIARFVPLLPLRVEEGGDEILTLILACLLPPCSRTKLIQ